MRGRLIGGITLYYPYRKGVGEMLFRQQGLIYPLTARWEGVTSKTARDGNEFLFTAASRLPLSLSHLPRCPCVIDMRPWSWMDRGMNVWVKVPPHWKGCLRQVGLLPISPHHQTGKKEELSS